MDDINDFYNSEEGFRIVNNFEDELSEEISENKPQKSQPVSKEIFEWLDVLATAIISVVIIFSILFRVATINGESMTNTLQNNDKVIITNLAYRNAAILWLFHVTLIIRSRVLPQGRCR